MKVQKNNQITAFGPCMIGHSSHKRHNDLATQYSSCRNVKISLFRYVTLLLCFYYVMGDI